MPSKLVNTNKCTNTEHETTLHFEQQLVNSNLLELNDFVTSNFN